MVWELYANSSTAAPVSGFKTNVAGSLALVSQYWVT